MKKELRIIIELKSEKVDNFRTTIVIQLVQKCCLQLVLMYAMSFISIY